MNEKNLSRREFLRLSAAFAAAVSAAGCRPEAPTAPAEPISVPTAAPAEPTAIPTAAPEEPVDIQFWWGWTPEIHVNAITAAVRKFEEYNPSIKVSTGQHEWGEKLTTAFAAGTPPDLFILGEVRTYASKGVVIPLDDYMAGSTIANRETFLEPTIEAQTWKGKVYGIPSLEHGPGLGTVFNVKMLEERGLKAPDDLPDTWEKAWEQILEYSQVEDNGNIKLLWFEPEVGTWVWWACTYDVLAYDNEAMKITFDDPRWKDILDYAVRYNQHFGPEKVKAFYESFPGWAAVSGCALCAEVLAGDINGFWAPGELAKTAPDKKFVYSWIPMPESRKGTTIQQVGGHCALISKDAKQHDAAWKLAEYLTTEEVNKIMFDGCGFLLVNKAFLANPHAVIGPDQWENMKFYIESITQASQVYGDNISPIDTFIWDQYSRAYDAAIFGEKTVEQALADLQSACSEELAKSISGT